MARLQFIVTASGAQGPAAFEAALNAVLAPLTSHTVLAWQPEVTDKLPAYNRDFRGVLDVQTGGTAIGTPYLARMFEGDSPEEVIALSQAFMAANPTYFFAPVQFLYSDQLPNIAKRWAFVVIYNTVLANGEANWAVGGGGGGGGGSGIPATPQTVVTAAMSPYTIQASDLYILLDTSAGPIQINLPTAATARVLRFKGITGTMQANPVTLVPDGADKIENLAANKIITTNFGSFDMLAAPSQSSWFTL